jgi:YhcH/YjgK/YiaL family protein
MIYDKFENSQLYVNGNALLKKAVAFLRQFDTSNENGRYEIDGDRMYVNVFSYETKPAEEQQFEAHRKYIDFHYILSGEEVIDVAIGAECKLSKSYSDDNDSILFSTADKYSSIKMMSGYFALFNPDDVHRPGCNYGSKSTIRKAVVKIRIGK